MAAVLVCSACLCMCVSVCVFMSVWGSHLGSLFAKSAKRNSSVQHCRNGTDKRGLRVHSLGFGGWERGIPGSGRTPREETPHS